MPFSVKVLEEGKMQKMVWKNLNQSGDTVIIIPNDKLLEVAPNLPLNSIHGF